MRNHTGKSLSEWRAIIRREAPYVDLKPYSHNIISIALQAIAKDHGNEEANKTIDDFNLERLGWSKSKKSK
mgnify:CR=1 FL=1